MKSLAILILATTSLLAGCVTTNQRILDSGSETQVQKRNYQTRFFDTGDKERVLRATISTLQDLGFVIDRADMKLGVISGTKMDLHTIKVTVNVRPQGGDRMQVRANGQINVSPIEDPAHYQDFFNSMEKSLFLAAHTE
ncbi:hypothetical protein EBQ25_03160 [Allofranklinella schreckenbergeri]|uniref:Uncharacterized protein n=1 Tax=Allofranklinella schreckenbergeri TaxID=1076744 RepID=A0A3M6QGS0_9BURK|nr:hypothetical protein [Allofranklinella schreckenbergeri]RMX01672.1 hypothetical protein EBQ25_03160 [Allofranklinella schreckenbergeri]